MGCCCKVTTLIIVIFVIVCIVLGSVLGSSVQFVPVGFYGLLMNTYTNVVDTDTVYDEGRYFFGPGHDFFTFPKYLKTIEWIDSTAISTQTLDGLSLKLDISMQYQLQKENVGLLFKNYMRTYESTFRTKAESIIRSTASQYRAVEFFYNRTSIGAACLAACQSGLASLYVSVPFLQMRKIDLPDTFEEAIVTTEVERQGVQTKEYEQQSASIRAQKGTIDAETNAQIALIQAATEANITLIMKTAEAQGVTITMEAYAQANSYLMSKLNFTSSQLLEYLYVDAVRQLPDVRTLVGLPNAIISA